LLVKYTDKIWSVELANLPRSISLEKGCLRFERFRLALFKNRR